MADHSPEPSAALAEFIDRLRFSDVSGRATEVVTSSVVDTVGVLLAGLDTEPARIVTTVFTAGETGEASRVFGSEHRVSPLDAAFIHGTAGHTLDFDDSSAGMNGHPSVTMVPAMLAVADTHVVTGEDLITAYVAGFETQCSIGRPILESHYRLGWHPTATLGTFGTAAAAGKLLGQSSDELRHGLNIAASMASGLKQNFGSMTKSLHVGHAARAGLTAALLAGEGFTADQGAIGASQGFWTLYGDELETDWAAPRSSPQGELAILRSGINLKKYPCCHFAHGAVTATIDLSEAHGIAPADVESIRVEGSLGAHDAAGIADPETALEGKFSMRYLVAAALTFGEVTFETFTRDRLFDPVVRTLLDSVAFTIDETRDYGSLATNVRIKTTDGRSFTKKNAVPPGLSRNPLSPAELHEKFLMCSTAAISEPAAEKSWRALHNLESLSDVSDALDALE